MAGLLDLPLELREPIFLDVVLETTEQKPEDPLSADLSASYQMMEEEETRDYRVSPGPILCKSLRLHAMPLLHINQQIRHEVIDLVLRHLGHRFDDAIVDVMYDVKDGAHRLWATWLSAPFPTIHLHTVHAQIRSFEVPLDPSRFHPGVLVQHDCHQWQSIRSAGLLLNFLAESLRTQATFASIHEARRVTSANETETANCTIQNLVIDIPFEPNPRRSPEARLGCARCARTNRDIPDGDGGVYRMVPSGKRAALVFARLFHEQLMEIFDAVPKYWRANTYPFIILERIGTIDLNVHGRLFRKLDLSKVLAKMPLREEWTRSGFSRSEFFKWKRSAEAKRRTAGLKVSAPSVQEHELAGYSGLIARKLVARGESLVREVILPPASDDVTLFASQPVWLSDCTGNAVFVQEDGTELSGNATFYSSIPYNLLKLNFYNPVQLDTLSWLYLTRQELEQQALARRQKNGEVVLFKGEAILFYSHRMLSTVTSGDATFYGRAEEASTSQSGSINEDS